MSSKEEIEARIQETAQRIDQIAADMDKRVEEARKEIHSRVSAQIFKESFTKGDQADYYHWTERRVLLPKVCFATNKIMPPGTKAYHGEIRPNAPMSDTLVPAEIWLTKEEFTFRRIKGQI